MHYKYSQTKVVLQFTEYKFVVSGMGVNQFLCIIFSLLLHYAMHSQKFPAHFFQLFWSVEV